jgi:hypothetical protein
MGELDRFERWRFEGIQLAIESASVRIGIRTHEHIYPHTPGASTEKMGRDLYQVDVSGRFDTNLPSAQYPNPLLAAGGLRMLCEEETTGDLVIPWIGTVQAYCKELTLSEKNTIRSGLSFSAKFIEDMDFEFPIQNFIQVNQKPMGDAKAQFDQWEYQADIFSQISEGVGFVLGIKDQFQLYGALVQSKIDYLEGLFREADATAKELSDPKNLLGLDAFVALWDSIRTFGNDIAAKGITFSYWVVPIEMTIQQVANALKVLSPGITPGDLLGLNPINDTLAIPAGTRIRYYAAAQ